MERHYGTRFAFVAVRDPAADNSSDLAARRLPLNSGRGGCYMTAQFKFRTAVKSHLLDRSFSGSGELLDHVEKTFDYLNGVCVACKVGDKDAARYALRQAVNELETARNGIRIGMD
jgi:hypothetical protein